MKYTNLYQTLINGKMKYKLTYQSNNFDSYTNIDEKTTVYLERDESGLELRYLVEPFYEKWYINKNIKLEKIILMILNQNSLNNILYEYK